MIEILDLHKVSFVSVTQQFNTTSSMGRLTLNVLLSFAQFEREVTGERIRDKIAASKKKGMWMGGTIPMGYDCVDRQLIVNPIEARMVLKLYRTYLRLGCVRKLKEFLDKNRILSSVRMSGTGRSHGGAPYSRGALYHLLNNRIYIGEIAHRGQLFAGQHKPIVPMELWNKVAARLQENNQAHRVGESQSTPSLLRGILFDTNGARFTPTHAVKNGKRYRYYSSQTVIRHAGIKPAISRFPAQELEHLVKSQIHLLLQTLPKCTARMKDDPRKDTFIKCAKDLATEWPQMETAQQHDFARKTLRRVTIGQSTMWIEIDRTQLLASLLGQNSEAVRPLIIDEDKVLKLSSEFKWFRRRGELRVIAPGDGPFLDGACVPSLVKAVARANDWYERFVSGEFNSIGQLAQKCGLTRRYVRRILRCANLSPKITEALLSGKHSPNLTLKGILVNMPSGWRAQEERFLQ
jgi:site-specific DNA recombinase